MCGDGGTDCSSQFEEAHQRHAKRRLPGIIPVSNSESWINGTCTFRHATADPQAWCSTGSVEAELAKRTISPTVPDQIRTPTANKPLT